MKFGGLSSNDLNIVLVTVTRGDKACTLKVAPHSFGLLERLDDVWVMPEPPVRYVKSKTGKFLIGDNNEAVRDGEDRNDPEYRKNLKLWYSARNAVILKDCLRFEESVTFDTEEPSSQTPEAIRDYHSKLAAELAVSGLTEPEVEAILTASINASKGVELTKKIDESADAFLGK